MHWRELGWETPLYGIGAHVDAGILMDQAVSGPAVRARCFVCKQRIEVRGRDPCAVVLVTNAYGPRELQREQEFPCHLACFRQVLDEDEIFEIAKPDYPTIGEMRHEDPEDEPDDVEAAR